jgi:hypothetical protein
MTFLDEVSDNLGEALPLFRFVNPGARSLFPGKAARMFFKGLSWGKSAAKVIGGRRLDEELGERFGRRIVPIYILKGITTKSHLLKCANKSWFDKDPFWFKVEINKRGKITEAVKKDLIIFPL